ncbi:MAG: ABC transporter permease [Alphaproteobacteria bacterium]|nr:ABC transporter permease [Alphaproteobacteria bacterium]
MFRHLSWRRVGLLAIGGAVTVALVIAALFGPAITPLSPLEISVADRLQPPSAAHWLGTDELGRDTFSRTIYAARISVQVAAVAVGIGLIGGILIGLSSAYFGGAWDMTFMRGMDLVYAFPAVLLAIVIMAGLGTSMANAMIAIGIIFIPGFARLARATAQGVLRQQYIEAALSIGVSTPRLLFREILPNIATPLMVQAAIGFAYAVLVESALSFLGLGAQPPEPSWGVMINEGRGQMAAAPWLGIVPGAAIFISVLGFNMLGDGLRDFFDPQLRD